MPPSICSRAPLRSKARGRWSRGLRALAACGALLVASPAIAHPHIFIDAEVAVVFDGNGAVAGLRHAWTFDTAFSAWMVQGLDTNGDGIIDTARTGSVKMLEQGAATTGPNATVYVDDDVFDGGGGGTGDKADAEATTGILAHSYSSGTVVLTGVQFPDDLGLSVVTLTPTLIVIAQDGTNVLEIKITDPATGAYEVTQLAPMLHLTGDNENDIILTVGYDAVSSDGDTASGVLTINVNDDSVLFLASSDLDGAVTENGTLVATGHVDFKAADGATAVVDSSQTSLSYSPDGGPASPLPAGLTPKPGRMWLSAASHGHHGSSRQKKKCSRRPSCSS